MSTPVPQTLVQRATVDPDLVLLDLDGVVYRGAAAVPGAADSLRGFAHSGLPYAFLTNNAARTPETVASQLHGYGIPADPRQILTSGQACAEQLARELPAGAAVGVLGSQALHRAVAAAGLRAVTARTLPTQYAANDCPPAAIVMGFNPEMTVADVQRAIAAVRAGAAFWATNPDPTVPKETGEFPGNGTYVEIVSAFTSTRPRIAGKPAPLMPRTVIDSFGADAAVMVGDRCDTDIAAGRAAGATTVLVLSGIDDVHSAFAAAPAHRPDRIIANLGDLLRPLPPVRLAEGCATCGSGSAELDGSVLRTAGPPELAVQAALVLAAADPASSLDARDLPRRFDSEACA